MNKKTIYNRLPFQPLILANVNTQIAELSRETESLRLNQKRPFPIKPIEA